MGKWLFKQEDIEALLLGMTTYGTGGGGNPASGRDLLEAGFEKGREFMMIDPADVEDDAFICSGGIMGSVKDLKDENDQVTYSREHSAEMLVKAVQTMEEAKGRKVDYLIPFEVGGSNTPVIMLAASMLGIPTIDGDGVGRAAPETQMTSWIGHGVSLTPMPLVAKDGNRIIVMDGNEPTYADEVGRFIVVKGGGSGANAHYAMSGKTMKETSILNIISKALTLGKIQKEGLDKGENKINEVREFLGAKTLFVGKVLKEEGVNKGGFYLTELDVEGTGEFAGKKAQVVLKNETMVIYVEGKVRCIFPDYTYMLNPATGESIQTADIKEGMEIEFAGAPCAERLAETLDTEVAKKAFGGYRYGHPEISYIPFNELQD